MGMNVSRRKFLATFSASLATVFVSAGSASAGQALGSLLGKPGSSPLRGDALSWNSLYPYLHTDFEFSSRDGSRRSNDAIRLRLFEMSNTDRESTDSSEREPRSFVLTFKADAHENLVLLGQDTYAVEHFALGRFELFVSQGNVADEKHVYTAVINRVVG
jgi:hypothetical protein